MWQVDYKAGGDCGFCNDRAGMSLWESKIFTDKYAMVSLDVAESLEVRIFANQRSSVMVTKKKEVDTTKDFIEALAKWFLTTGPEEDKAAKRAAEKVLGK